MPPDPFEDIPAPRLRLLRPGAAPALAKPRPTPIVPLEAPAGRSWASDADGRSASGAASVGPTLSARASASTVLRVSRPEAAVPTEHRPSDDAREALVRSGGPWSNAAADAGAAEADAPTDGARIGPSFPTVAAAMEDAVDRESAHSVDAAASSHPNAGAPDTATPVAAGADAPPDTPAPGRAATIDAVAAGQRPKHKVRSARPVRRSRAPSDPGKPAASGAESTRASTQRGVRALADVVAPCAEASAAASVRPDPDHGDGAVPVAEPVAVVLPAAASQRRAPSRSDLRRGIIAGLIVAITLVTLALLMRPTSGGSTPAPDTTAVPVVVASPPVPDPARTASMAVTQTAAIAVRLRLGPDPSVAYRDALRAAVEGAGYASVEVRAMPFPIDRSRIQFYAPADRPAAEALARALAPLTGELVEMRDLGPVAGPDEAGSIDAWLVAESAK